MNLDECIEECRLLHNNICVEIELWKPTLSQGREICSWIFNDKTGKESEGIAERQSKMINSVTLTKEFVSKTHELTKEIANLSSDDFYKYLLSSQEISAKSYTRIFSAFSSIVTEVYMKSLNGSSMVVADGEN